VGLVSDVPAAAAREERARHVHASLAHVKWLNPPAGADGRGRRAHERERRHHLGRPPNTSCGNKDGAMTSGAITSTGARLRGAAGQRRPRSRTCRRRRWTQYMFTNSDLDMAEVDREGERQLFPGHPKLQQQQPVAVERDRLRRYGPRRDSRDGAGARPDVQTVENDMASVSISGAGALAPLNGLAHRDGSDHLVGERDRSTGWCTR